MRSHGGSFTTRETESTRRPSRFDRHEVVAQAMQPSPSKSTSRGRAIMTWRFPCAMALTGALVAGPALAQSTPGKAPTPALPGSTPPNSQPGTLPGSPPPPSMPQSGIPARPPGPTDTLGNPQSPTGPGPMAPCPPGTLSQPCIPGAARRPWGRGSRAFLGRRRLPCRDEALLVRDLAGEPPRLHPPDVLRLHRVELGEGGTLRIGQGLIEEVAHHDLAGTRHGVEARAQVHGIRHRAHVRAAERAEGENLHFA